MADRSRSRGRVDEPVYSSGRGGAGNIRPISREPNATRVKGPDDFSPSRGREVPAIGNTLTHSGRGGAGNVRSPSRDAEGNVKAAREVNEYVAAHQHTDAPYSSGRGGAGNINRSRSRSKEPRISSSTQHTYGHGGAGNVAPGVAHGEGYLASVEENEARQYQQTGGIHSTGRGGAGNLTSANAPSRAAEAAEAGAHHHAGGAASSGRGGAGNINSY